jgi:hypothetical protein
VTPSSRSERMESPTIAVTPSKCLHIDLPACTPQHCFQSAPQLPEGAGCSAFDGSICSQACGALPQGPAATQDISKACPTVGSLADAFATVHAETHPLVPQDLCTLPHCDTTSNNTAGIIWCCILGRMACIKFESFCCCDGRHCCNPADNCFANLSLRSSTLLTQLCTAAPYRRCCSIESFNLEQHPA